MKETVRVWVDEAIGDLVVLGFCARMKPARARRLAELLIKHADAVEARQAKARARKRRK